MLYKRKNKVALFPGDFVNLGDAMLSLAAARFIAKGGDSCTLLPYRKPNEVVFKEFEKEGFVVIGIRENPFAAIRACWGSLIWIGGGHAIRNEVSFGWLFFTLMMASWASLSGRSVRVIGAGASSIRTGWKKYFYASIFHLCEKICVRDQVSANCVSSEFPANHTKIEITGDLAFLKDCIILHTDLTESATCLVSPGIDTLEGRKENSLEIMGILRTLFERSGMNHVIVVSHDSRNEFGLSYCRELKEIIEREIPVTVDLVNEEQIEVGLLVPYGRARWVVTGRLHGLIIGALNSCHVFYTTGSADKLRPFADLFNFKIALKLKAFENLSNQSELVKTAVIAQQKAAELNFEK